MVDFTPEPDKTIEEAQREPCECLRFEYSSVYVPSGSRDSVEVDGALDFETGLLEPRAKFVARIAAEMAQRRVERPEKRLIVRHQNDEAAAFGQDGIQALERSQIVFHVFENVQKNDGVDAPDELRQVVLAFNVAPAHLDVGAIAESVSQALNVLEVYIQ